MEEDGGDAGRIGEEREDPHLATADGTEHRQHVVDPREQDGLVRVGNGLGLALRRRGRVNRYPRRLGPKAMQREE